MDRKIRHTPTKLLLKRWRPITAIIGALIGITALYSFAFEHGERVQRVDGEMLTLSTVTQGAFSNVLRLRGNVKPKKSVLLDTSSGGSVEEISVEPGTSVKKGQILLRLSNPTLQLDVMSREAQIAEQMNFLRNTQMTMETNLLDLRRDLLEVDLQLSHLNRKFKQTQPLLDDGVIARDALEAIESDLIYYRARRQLTLDRQAQEKSIRQVQIAQLQDSADMLQKNLAFARKNLEDLIVRAPVDGYLSALDAQLGESKPAGASMGQIDIPDQFTLKVNVDEFYINQVRIGLLARLKQDDNVYDLRVTKLDTQGENALFTIEIDLPENMASLKRGQTLDIDLRIDGEQQNAVLLPRGPFYNQSGGNWLFVVSQDTRYAERRSVQLGKKNQYHYHVLDGVEPGEQVITSSYSAFENAQRIKIE
jgi:HlyD family secretion protein